MAEIIGEYTIFKRSPITCKKCGWSGFGRDCPVAEVYEGGQICDYDCPACGEYLRACQWPLIGEKQTGI